MNTSKINVAIDGPAGAGKSTVAKKVAQKLGYIYVDTGAMYRAVTLEMLRRQLPLERKDEIGKLAKHLSIRLLSTESGQRVLLNGEDVTEEIRSPEVSRLVSKIAAIPVVRNVLVHVQKQMVADKGVVMDGRDIGTHVIPDAEVKIFLTASVEERARRRFDEMKRAGSPLTYEELVRDIAERDRMDQERETAPLIQAADAVYLDSTGMTIAQVVDRIIHLCRLAMARGESYG